MPVTVFEGAPALSRESRASTFHPSTLDMLDDLGLVDALIATGLVPPRVQYRTSHDGVIAAFDFAGVADVTRHPYRPQSEQNNRASSRASSRPIRTTASSSAGASAARGRTPTASL